VGLLRTQHFGSLLTGSTFKVGFAHLLLGSRSQEGVGYSGNGSAVVDHHRIAKARDDQEDDNAIRVVYVRTPAQRGHRRRRRRSSKFEI